jgi:hypothetical protein
MSLGRPSGLGRDGFAHVSRRRVGWHFVEFTGGDPLAFVRAKALSPEQRREIASKAASARWQKSKQAHALL